MLDLDCVGCSANKQDMPKLIFYNVETTGVNHMKHSIVELSGLVEIDGKIVESFDYKIKPHEKARIEPEALTANKLKLEDIMLYPHMSEAFRAFKNMLEKYVDKYNKQDKFHLVGYNNRYFDDNFLRMFFKLSENSFYGAYFWADTIDVLPLASHVLMHIRHTMPSFKLHRVAKTLNISVEDAELHSALYDTHLTRKVYYSLFPKNLS